MFEQRKRTNSIVSIGIIIIYVSDTPLILVTRYSDFFQNTDYSKSSAKISSVSFVNSFPVFPNSSIKIFNCFFKYQKVKPSSLSPSRVTEAPVIDFKH